MHTTNARKFLSVALSLTLGISSLPMRSAAAPASPAMPDFVKALTPSQNLGFVESYYQGSTEHPVVLIQDLHANYGVQKKILGLLNFLQPQVAPAGHSMVLGIEGAWGPINLTPIRNEEFVIRKQASDLMLKESEISAMEYYAALSENEVKFVGIDDPNDYTVHLQLFRKSLAARLALAKKADLLRNTLAGVKGEAPSELRRLWRLQDDFHAGRIDLAQLSKKLNVQVTSYKEAEKALSGAISTQVANQKGESGFTLSNVASADESLSWLSRLLRQQLSLEEVQIAAKQIPAMLTTVRALLPGESTSLWQDTIRTAIDHYAVAMLRNQPLSQHALELAQQHSDSSVVIVTGGFHTTSIAELLKSKNVSYVVIAPIVESHTARDEEVYVQRMLDIHVTEGELETALSDGNRRLDRQTIVQPRAILNNINVNPLKIAPGVQAVASRVFSAIRKINPWRSSSNEIRTALDLHNAITVTEPKINSGIVATVKGWFNRSTGNLQTINIPAVESKDGKSKPKTAADVKELTTEAKEVTLPKGAAVATTVLIGAGIVQAMRSVPVDQAIGRAMTGAKAVTEVAQAGIGSSALDYATAATVVAAGVYALWGTKTGKKTREEAAKYAKIITSA